MKLLHFADLHLDAPFAGLPPDVARRRRQALRDTLVRIVDLARAENVDALLCGGDLYEQERCTADTGELLRRQLGRLAPVPVILAPGNHDWLGPASLYARVDWPSNVHLFTESHLQPLDLADGLTLWGAAHRAPANTDGFLEDFRVDRPGVHLALFHGSERGGLALQEKGKQPHAPFDAEQIERAGIQHAFLGHYHRPRDAERHTYPGNPNPLEFGEDGERGVICAEVSEDGRVAITRHVVAGMPAHDDTVDISDCSNRQDVRERLAELLAGRTGIARITLVGDVAPELELQRGDLADVVPTLEWIDVRMDRVRVEYDLAAIAREPTVRGQFVRDVMAAGLADDEQRRVLVTGLRALDGRSDLEVP